MGTVNEMQFPELIQEKDKLVATFSREHNVPLQDIRVIAAPYRISPLGAHIDHQGGPVLGMTINAYFNSMGANWRIIFNAGQAISSVKSTAFNAA